MPESRKPRRSFLRRNNTFWVAVAMIGPLIGLAVGMFVYTIARVFGAFE